MKIWACDILEMQTDIIVNASNGVGYMGGDLAMITPLEGVAEKINYATKGKVEKEARAACKKNWFIPSILTPKHPGEVYFTKGYGVIKIGIIHAVIKYYPGLRTNYEVIKKLLPKIIELSLNMNARSLSIPLLGCGAKGLQENEVIRIYNDYFLNLKSDIEVYVCIKNRGYETNDGNGSR